MVCVPCIVIPFLLWVFNRYIRPIISKFWNPSTEKLEQSKCPFKGSPTDSSGTSTIPETEARIIFSYFTVNNLKAEIIGL
ncbi:hypothetical protein LOTGIDRAFT_212970 [Lottia gigantea]|uniref:Uncharacterized protein n=1 Tax=Lottia gigantea TaxID=225164 RepID=V4A960_LOTGI|nr:hypothetical protein LOTGIDRAFT_212970 [Lottia gigantea]ESP00504.1 hypothetical protein LOTGIDRAFT_212970 [Lottia gigantea]